MRLNNSVYNEHNVCCVRVENSTVTESEMDTETETESVIVDRSVSLDVCLFVCLSACVRLSGSISVWVC